MRALGLDLGERRVGVAVCDSAGTVATPVETLVRTGDPERDRFVLSKGHAALALYAALHLKGWVTAEQLETYCGDGTTLGVHPEASLAGVDFASGSLGHGLSMGAGAALAARLQGSQQGSQQGSLRRAFVLVSDAECNEGSLWEAAMFAAHHKLSNLVVVVDVNGQQALGYTRDVVDLSPLAERWRAFGWHVDEVDAQGDDAEARLSSALSKTGGGSGPPRAVVARTVFGKGVSFMKNQIKWHYWPMSEEQYRQAVEEVDPAFMRAAFIETLVELAEDDPRIVFLTGDLGYTAVEPFAERFPSRFFNVGVAEQNMLGLADRPGRRRLHAVCLLDCAVRRAASL